MQQGFNSDVMYKGSTYHVQTQDWGEQNPFFVSQIFMNGALVKNIKIPYTKVLSGNGGFSVQSIRIALESQHQSVMDLLLAGRLI